MLKYMKNFSGIERGFCLEKDNCRRFGASYFAFRLRKKTVGTDYDFSPVIEKTVEQIIEAAPSPVHDSIYGEWSVINAARSGVLVPQSWFDEYYANLSAALKEADGVLSATKNTE